MSAKKKNQAIPGSSVHLDDLDTAWRVGALPCPYCGQDIPMEGVASLEMHDCPHCGNQYFMPRKMGDYYLYEPGGGGGMGSVYKTVSRRFPGKVLAMKLLARKARDTPSNIHALLNEAEVSSHFNDSEYLAACFDSGYMDDEYFTVMPYITGEGLDKRIARLTKMPPAEVVPMTMHILAAEQHIYRKGYLFRDMKPENIIINQYGYAILLDFGLCIPLEQARNPQDEFISGSPYFMPPERLLGKPEDAYSEIYSIGMVIYNALTGTTIYDADDLDALAHRHVAKLKVNNASKMTDIPKDIAVILEKMIRREPEERYQTFQEVAEAFKQLKY
ncbi:MAG: serine/threonine protein kinase [Victivallales bacterium]|jgi:serine/threonine protein kinase|nr:serine/threonine protein kinase [Victivallales bacterium]